MPVTTQPVPAAIDKSGTGTPAAATPTTTTTTGQPPANGNPMDPAYIRQWVNYYATISGTNPSLQRDPDYWVNRILQTGGWQGDNAGYWSGPEGFYRPEGAPEGAGRTGGTRPPAPAQMSYEQALARAQEIAQQYWGRALTPAEIQSYITRYGGGPGTVTTQAQLSPVLLDIMQHKPGANTTASGRAPFQPLEASLNGGYNDAVQVIKDRYKQYYGKDISAPDLQALLQRYNVTETGAAGQGELLRSNRLDPNMSGSAQQALDYLNQESTRLRGRALNQQEIDWATQQIGYQPGQSITGAQVNTLLNTLDQQATNRGAGTPGSARRYTANDVNPILQDLYNGAGTGGTGGGGGGGGTNGDPYGLASYLTSSPLLAPWTREFSADKWTAPTELTEQNDPGYQARMRLGEQAIQRSAASKGTLLTGGTLKDLTQFGQDYGSGEFQNVYNRSLSDWSTNYNKSAAEYAQAYNIFENNQAKQYNRIANLAGLGQTAAGQLGSVGVNTAGTLGSLASNQNRNLSDLWSGIGNANAAGIIGAGNANAGAISGIGSLGAAGASSLYDFWSGNRAGQKPA